MTTKPIRIQLKRTKGFRLQEVSQASNGLHCVKVDRSTDFGNPYEIGDREMSWRSAVVEMFRGWIDEPAQAPLRSRIRAELQGKNCACWCPLPAPGERDICHATILIALANSETSDG